MAVVPTILSLTLIFFCIFPLVITFRFFGMKFYKDEKVVFLPTERLFYFDKDQLICFFFLHGTFIMTYKLCPEVITNVHSLIYIFFVLFSVILTIFMIIAEPYLKINEFNILSSLGCWMLFFILSFSYTKNYIVLAFNIELLAVIYLFFFLGHFKTRNISLVKYKNLLSNYLFSSFFTLIFFFTVLNVIVFLLGTVSFKQLNVLHSVIPRFVCYFLLISLFIKFGGPLFFFFKLEVYKLLPISTLIFFSLSSFWLNSFLISFLSSSCNLFFSSFTLFFLSLLLFSNLFVMIRGLQLSNFSEFFAYSAINTWGLFFLFFFLIVTIFSNFLFLFKRCFSFYSTFNFKTNLF